MEEERELREEVSEIMDSGEESTEVVLERDERRIELE